MEEKEINMMCEQKYSIILRQCRLLGAGDRETVDIAIDDDTIVAVSPRISGLGEQEIDIQGNLVSPPFVESHIHLDSALTAGNRDGIKAVLCSREFKFGVNASKV
jgi:cytosine/creatinine deaminase